MKSIAALILPDREVARQILALNTEKAHNLRERALEVIRIYRALLEEEPSKPESGFGFYLEDPALVTLGIAYEGNKTFAGGAYHPVLRRVEEFSEEPIRSTVKTHERRAALVIELEEKVGDVVARLKERGPQSPYLRSFVVARINPLRFIKGDCRRRNKCFRPCATGPKFNVEKVRQEDLFGAFAAVADEE